MKKIIVSLIFLLTTSIAFSQTFKDTIVVAPGGSGLHFYHIIEKGETLDHISKKYDISQKELLAVNHIEKLKPYEIIKIPLKKQDIIQSGNKTINAQLQPLYHKVSKGETLYRVGKLYSDIPLKTIKSWNNLQGNTIHANQYLIIGWYKPNNNKTSEKINNTQVADKTSQTNEITKKRNEPEVPAPADYSTSKNSSKEGNLFLEEVISSEKQRIKEEQPKRIKNEQEELIAKAETTPVQEKPIHKTKKPSKNKEVALPFSSSKTTSDSPVKQKENSKEDKATNQFENMLSQISSKPSKKVTTPDLETQKQPQPEKEISPKKEVVEKEDTVEKIEVEEKADSGTLVLAQKSVFSELFLAQTQNQKLLDNKKGAAGWFKSNIKPGSKKYYALCNDLPRGTIIKVINPINNKYIFAKVLSSIPQSKENYNLIVKLSDAAKDDLEITESRFWSEIIFPKIGEE